MKMKHIGVGEYSQKARKGNMHGAYVIEAQKADREDELDPRRGLGLESPKTSDGVFGQRYEMRV